MKFRNPDIKLINSSDSVYYAYEVSRPQGRNIDITEDADKLVDMNMSLTGLRHYVLHITSSLLFRDLLLTMRPTSGVWCQSNRANKFDNDHLFISGEYKNIDNSYLKKCLDDIFKRSESGESQDIIKQDLPLATSTEFVISIDDRTLIMFVNVLKLHFKKLYEVYGKLILDKIGKDESYLDKRSMVDIIDKLKLSDEEIEVISKENISSNCDMLIGGFTVQANLLAQFIRMHTATIKNGMYNEYSDKEDELSYSVCDTCKKEFYVFMYVNKDSFNQTMSHRCCWSAQFDKCDKSGWGHIIDNIIKNYSLNEFIKLLPCRCNNRNCIIKEDIELRKQNINSSLLPCAIYCKDSSLINKRKEVNKSDSIIFNFWEKLIPVIDKIS